MVQHLSRESQSSRHRFWSPQHVQISWEVIQERNPHTQPPQITVLLNLNLVQQDSNSIFYEGKVPEFSEKAQEFQLKGFPYVNLTVEKQFGYFTPSLKFGRFFASKHVISITRDKT